MLSGLRIPCYCGSGVALIPSPGTSICSRCSPKKTKKKRIGFSHQWACSILKGSEGGGKEGGREGREDEQPPEGALHSSTRKRWLCISPLQALEDAKDPKEDLCSGVPAYWGVSSLQAERVPLPLVAGAQVGGWGIILDRILPHPPPASHHRVQLH